MDVKYEVEGKGSIVIALDPREVANSAILMQLVLEEEGRKGTLVPDLKNDFFENLAKAEKKVHIKFDYEYFPFAITFLEEMCGEWGKAGGNTHGLEKFLDELFQYCSVGHTLH